MKHIQSMTQRVALVTGGGRGIGARQRYCWRPLAPALWPSRVTMPSSPHWAWSMWSRIWDSRRLRPAVAETERRLGPIDLLVVNHGHRLRPRAPRLGTGPQVWRETMRVNLDGPFELTRLTVVECANAGSGASSTRAHCRGKGRAQWQRLHRFEAWCHRTRASVAQDAGPFGVTSNAVLPGWVRTAMAERSAQTEAQRRNVPSIRFGASAPPSIRRIGCWSLGSCGGYCVSVHRCSWRRNGEAITVAWVASGRQQRQ